VRRGTGNIWDVTTGDDTHSSPLRDLMAQAQGGRYVSYSSLQEAQADDKGCVILEGDDGGQIYLAVPARSVTCSEETLATLLGDLDAIASPGNDEDSARVVFERRPVGSGVPGGMGGGSVSADGWVHGEFVSLGIDQEVREVLRGTRDRLSESARGSRRERRRPPLP
jgi:hypothetical protein